MNRAEQEDHKYYLSADKMCNIDVDDDFYNFIKYIFELNAERKPNFEHMTDIIRTIQDKYAIPRDDKRFCWNLHGKIADKMALKFKRLQTM